MKSIARIFGPLVVIAIAGICCANSPSKPAGGKVMRASSPRALIAGANVSAATSITPQSINFVQDGTYQVILDVVLNGAHRTRIVTVSGDGTALAFDGVPVPSPPAAATNLAAELVTLGTRMTAMFSNAAVQSAMTAP